MLDYYSDRLSVEFDEARTEYLRLAQLFKDVCWYNFETECKGWRRPWRSSLSSSVVHLHGMRFKQYWSRGRLMEQGDFPIWFEGSVADAPQLPPEIVLHELLEAKRHMQACEEATRAPYEWAPGGVKYEALRRTTLVGKRCVRDGKRKFSIA